METQIIKPRSYVSCLSQGLSYPLTHFAGIIRFTWPAALLSTIISVALGLLAVRVAQLQDTATLVLLLILEVFDIVGFAIYLGHVVWQQRRLVELGYIPRVRSWHVWRELWGPIMRSLLCALVVELLMVAMVGIFFVALFLIPSRWLLLASLLPLVVWFFLLPVANHWLFSSDPLSEASSSYRFRYTGRLFVVTLLSGFVTLLVVLLGGLPYGLCCYVSVQSTMATLMGDTAPLPAYFPWLSLLGLLFLQFVALCALVLMVYPQLFHWGSATAIEHERQEQAENLTFEA